MSKLQTNAYVQGVLAGDRGLLARTITLVESNAPHHFEQAQAVLTQLLPHAGKSIRVGITGVPGAGKSTLIETLGLKLVKAGHRVAVLAVDPTSSLSKGSILGDKTRMEMLARAENAFVRPSPTGGMLGGVARKTRESILVCEAAGYDVILVETVGTGQSEIAVRSMVDFFLLLLVPGAGDELQGLKKGVVEIADAILINKADGDNKIRAEAARVEYNRALHFLSPAVEGWQPRAYTSSARNDEGIDNIWDIIETFQHTMVASGAWRERREAQRQAWLHSIIMEQLERHFYDASAVKAALPDLETAVRQNKLSPTKAALQLMQIYHRANRQ